MTVHASMRSPDAAASVIRACPPGSGPLESAAIVTEIISPGSRCRTMASAPIIRWRAAALPISVSSMSTSMAGSR